MDFRMYGDDTVKFKYDGEQFCLHIQRDDTPMDPRADWDNPGTIMACWHRRYNLGDEIQDKTPEEFWQRLVRENVSESEILAAVKAGKLHGIRIAECEGEDSQGLFNIFETCSIWGQEPKGYLEYAEVCEGYIVDYLMDDLNIGHCMTLMAPYAAWLKLWLYDHSGITMSCSRGGNPFSCPWDSGQVGWIVCLKKDAMREFVEIIKDENGDPIKVEHFHEGRPSTWSYKTRLLTDETWKDRAMEIMESEVELYDQYLTGDVYGFTLLKRTEDEDGEENWEEVDSCWGFFGSDLFENGIVGEIPGLRKAIESGECERGDAKLVTHSYYTY